MAYVEFNPNPYGARVGDCVVRAVALATESDWGYVHIALSVLSFLMGDMANSNAVWGAYLHENGFRRYAIPDTCPDCYTVRDFCEDNPEGMYILATGTHVVTVIDGDYFDAWDSGDELPVYFWRKEE